MRNDNRRSSDPSQLKKPPQLPPLLVSLSVNVSTNILNSQNEYQPPPLLLLSLLLKTYHLWMTRTLRSPKTTLLAPDRLKLLLQWMSQIKCQDQLQNLSFISSADPEGGCNDHHYSITIPTPSLLLLPSFSSYSLYCIDPLAHSFDHLSSVFVHLLS